jgi:hypothetical protein
MSNLNLKIRNSEDENIFIEDINEYDKYVDRTELLPKDFD